MFLTIWFKIKSVKEIKDNWVVRGWVKIMFDFSRLDFTTKCL